MYVWIHVYIFMCDYICECENMCVFCICECACKHTQVYTKCDASSICNYIYPHHIYEQYKLIIYIYAHHTSTSLFLTLSHMRNMGWLRLVGSLKLWVAFAKEPYKRDYILQKRPISLRSLLIVATTYHIYISTFIHPHHI